MVPGLLLFGGTLLYTAATREGDLSVVAVLGVAVPGRHGRVGVRVAGGAVDAGAGPGCGCRDGRVGVARGVALSHRRGAPAHGPRAPPPRWRVQTRSVWGAGSGAVVGLVEVPVALGASRRRRPAPACDSGGRSALPARRGGTLQEAHGVTPPRVVIRGFEAKRAPCPGTWALLPISRFDARAPPVGERERGERSRERPQRRLEPRWVVRRHAGVGDAQPVSSAPATA